MGHQGITKVVSKNGIRSLAFSAVWCSSWVNASRASTCVTSQRMCAPSWKTLGVVVSMSCYCIMITWKITPQIRITRASCWSLITFPSSQTPCPADVMSMSNHHFQVALAKAVCQTRHAYTPRLQSDNPPTLTAGVSNEFMKVSHVTKVTSTAGHPLLNGWLSVRTALSHLVASI